MLARLAPVLGELARWGYEWAWGAPRPTELVDVTAIFRTLPGLVATDGSAQGTVLLTVSDGHHGAPHHALLTIDGNGATLAEPPAPGRTDAIIAGPAAAWVRALEPLGDPAALSRAGREDLVASVLALLMLGRSAQAELPAAETA